MSLVYLADDQLPMGTQLICSFSQANVLVNMFNHWELVILNHLTSQFHGSHLFTLHGRFQEIGLISISFTGGSDYTVFQDSLQSRQDQLRATERIIQSAWHAEVSAVPLSYC